MARQISPAMRERAQHVGSYIRSHKGEGSMADLMRRAQASFNSRGSDSMPERSNPRGISKGLVVVGLLAAGATRTTIHSTRPGRRFRARTLAPVRPASDPAPTKHAERSVWICSD